GLGDGLTAAGCGQGADQQVDALIAAAPQDHLLGADRVPVGQRRDQVGRLRVRVAPCSALRVGRGGGGGLVGVQPDGGRHVGIGAAGGGVPGEAAQVLPEQRGGKQFLG